MESMQMNEMKQPGNYCMLRTIIGMIVRGDDNGPIVDLVRGQDEDGMRIQPLLGSSLLRSVFPQRQILVGAS